MKYKIRKSFLAILVCVALIMSNSISVFANEESEGASGPEVSSEAEPTAEPTTEPKADNLEPSATPEPSKTPEPSETPAPSATPEPSETPAPSATPEPSETPAPSATPEPSETPAPSATPEPTATPIPVEKLLVSHSMQVNAAITDNGDDNGNTFAVVLEAWTDNIVSKLADESEVPETQIEAGEGKVEIVKDDDGNDLLKKIIYEEGTTCDGSAVLRNQISQYFEFYCSCESEEHTCIEVYTAAWDGSQFLEPVQIYPGSEQSEVSVVLNGNTIEVSGFDYKNHTVIADDVSGIGQKLIVKASVEAKEGFWGGNNVPVIEDVTAVYMNGEAEAVYDTLSANVPVFANITTKDKTIYYGGSISDNELLNGVTAGYKTAGTEEAGGVVSINEDGTLTPLEDWMDDYATITWNTYAGQNWTEAVGNIFGNAVSKVGTGRYAYAVTIAPREEAAANAGAAIPMEGVTDSADGIAYVLVPIVNFRNTVINRGYVPDQSYFENYNMVSVEWMEMNGFALESEGDDDPYTHPAPDYSLEPALYFTYQPIDPTFSADTGVNVSVFSSNDNAEEGIYMANGTVFGDLVATMDVDDCGGAFTILVEYIAPFELPETGGMGTAGFTTIGLVLLMCAVVLVWKKERNVE